MPFFIYLYGVLCACNWRCLDPSVLVFFYRYLYDVLCATMLLSDVVRPSHSRVYFCSMASTSNWATFARAPFHINVWITDNSVLVVVWSEAVLALAVLYWVPVKRQYSECLRCMLIQVDAEDVI